MVPEEFGSLDGVGAAELDGVPGRTGARVAVAITACEGRVPDEDGSDDGGDADELDDWPLIDDGDGNVDGDPDALPLGQSRGFSTNVPDEDGSDDGGAASELDDSGADDGDPGGIPRG